MSYDLHEHEGFFGGGEGNMRTYPNAIPSGDNHPGYLDVPPYAAKAETAQKCDMCGSTTVDHTEMQCQMNRLSKPPKQSKRK